MNALLHRFWQWVDSRAIVRRIVLFVTLWLTIDAFKWAAAFALVSKLSGTDTAAVIFAVTTPVTALQGFTFKHYRAGRTAEISAKGSPNE